MHKIFWALPGELAGRAGPNEAPWDLAEFYRHGIRAILTVNSGTDVVSEEICREGIDHLHLPFPVGTPPDQENFQLGLEVLPKAYDWYLRQVQARKPVLVHCTSGKDRTGLFIAYTMIRRLDIDVGQAIQRLMQVRPIALSAEGWEDFALRVLTAVTQTDAK